MNTAILKTSRKSGIALHAYESLSYLLREDGLQSVANTLFCLEDINCSLWFEAEECFNSLSRALWVFSTSVSTLTNGSVLKG